MTAFVFITNVVKNSMLLSTRSLFGELLILSFTKRTESRLKKQSFNLVTKRWEGTANGEQSVWQQVSGVSNPAIVTF